MNRDMNMQRYLAHVSEDNRVQLLSDHLNGTSEMCGEFARAFGAEDQGKLVGLMHDIGKYSDAFQCRLRGGPKVDHSTAGALECVKNKQMAAAMCIAGHHAGLPDLGARTMLEGSSLCARMERAKLNPPPPYAYWTKEISCPEASIPSFCKDCLSASFFSRMLYSCLVDADYLDTEAFMSGTNKIQAKGDFEILNARLDRYIMPWFPPVGELNKLRCDILNDCIMRGETTEDGLFSLTVPTGGGKTVASLAFALRHARRNKKSRVIYVIPYTSIIEQTAEVFRKILGADNVLEHHSGVVFDIDEATPGNMRMARATENWDMPVIVTTAVQFFESLFSNRSSKCRKLHNIANSVIIFDEAQMIPVPNLRPCVHAIAQLVDHYKVSAVLCTATQPALNGIFKEFLPQHEIEELCSGDLFHADVFKRVVFEFSGLLTTEELSYCLNQHDQVLCIVNSRKSARLVYDLLESDGAFHLSTLMVPVQRKEVLSEIRRRLKEGLPCRVVSTSLIEAGVDVDFPRVYRELAGLDSILQAAGRCNREGRRTRAESVVTVFKSDRVAPILQQASIAATEQVIENQVDIGSIDSVRDYFVRLMTMKGEAAQDKNEILTLLNRMAIASAAERFRMIEDNTRTIYIPWREGEILTSRLMSGERSRELLRSSGHYTVSVYEEQFRTLETAGVLWLLEDGSAVLMDQRLYNEATGLESDPASGQALFI